MSANDIRWIQRFNNFSKAFNQLAEATELSRQRELSKLEMQGLVQAFEYTHELAWNTLKDFLEEHGGVKKIYGSKDATREAFKAELIEDGDVWMDMIKSRNQTTHTYDEETVLEIVNDVTKSYFAEFKSLYEKLKDFKEEESA
ncbi:MAG: nucleotidyltransferase substrate binding protein [Nitrospirota bacterium]